MVADDADDDVRGDGRALRFGGPANHCNQRETDSCPTHHAVAFHHRRIYRGLAGGVNISLALLKDPPGVGPPLRT